jgi:hypothetical protein
LGLIRDARRGLRQWADRLSGRERAQARADERESDLRAEIAELRAALASHSETCAARFGAIAQQGHALEQLLTASPAARPPGAAEAVRALGDPAIAVILPLYNRARFVGEAIASVQAQSFGAFELIVVDDGSTDGSEAAVRPFLDDHRVKYVRKDNGGSSSARNLGIELSRAPLIAYLDSDNLYYPDFLGIAVDHLATHPDDDFVYGALVTHLHDLGPHCILWRPFDRAALKQGNFIDTNVIAHRRSLYDRYGGWDTRVSALNDWDIALRYTADKPARALPPLAAFYRKCDDIRATEGGTQPEEEKLIRAKPEG